MTRVASSARKALVEGLILLLRGYQWLISPIFAFLGVQCRFAPSCSEYMVGSLRKHGPVTGLLRGVARLSRCHPWHPGGYDPP